MKTAGVFHYVNAKIPEVSVVSQMERFISVSSDRNIREHLRLTAAWLAQLVERQSGVREVEGSSPRPDQHSGS